MNKITADHLARRAYVTRGQETGQDSRLHEVRGFDIIPHQISLGPFCNHRRFKRSCLAPARLGRRKSGAVTDQST